MTVTRLWLPGLGDVSVPLQGLPSSSSSGSTSSGSGSSSSGSSGSSSAGAGARGPPGDPPGGLRAALGPATARLLAESIAVNSTAELRQGEGGAVDRVGNRTECGLLELGERLAAPGEGGYAGARAAAGAPLRTLCFSSDRKRMTTLVRRPGGGARAHTKGALEVVLELCSRQRGADGAEAALGPEEKDALLERCLGDGQRFLALAYRDFGEDTDVTQHPGLLERDLTLLAVVGLSDPLRPGVPDAIAACHRAGITVRMLTGDNPATAAAIARECGILPSAAELPQAGASPGGSLGASPGPSSTASTDTEDTLEERRASHAAASTSGGPTSNGAQPPGATSPQGAGRGEEAASAGAVMTGQSFRQRVVRPDGTLDPGAFDAVWGRLRVLGRCTPQDKLTIVKALQRDPAEVVAMTGDGTNDAPALRLADVGFAMAAGTAIAKEASDILLLDNAFESIVVAVKYGRSIYRNVTKFIQFQLVVNVVAVTTAVVGALTTHDSPLTAVQMLWVNLIMDSLASLSLATEPPTDEVLDQAPFSPQEPLLQPSVLKGIVGQSLFQLGVMALLVYHGPAIFGVEHAGDALEGSSVHYTLVFNAFVQMQLFNQVNARKINDGWNVLEGLAQNRLFLGILAAEAAAQVAIVQYGGDIFSTQPLSWGQWGACVGIGSLSLLVRLALTRLPPHFGSSESGRKA